MLKFLADILKKNRSLIVYLALGAATTVVNFIIYYPLLNVVNFSAAVSNVIAWSASVIFAFLTNKPFAFNSKNWTVRVTAVEFLKFLGCRLASGVFETVFLAVTVDVLLLSGNIMKLLISVVVVIANYLGSKYFVFRK